MNEAAKSTAPALGAATVGDETRAAAALSELIARGIDAVTVRRDLTVADIYTLVLAARLDQPDAVRSDGHGRCCLVRRRLRPRST